MLVSHAMGWRRKYAAATEHSPRIAVRIPEALRDDVVMRATAEGKNLSQVVRGLLEDYAHSPVRDDPLLAVAVRER